MKKAYTYTCTRCGEVIKAYSYDNLQKGLDWHNHKKHGLFVLSQPDTQKQKE